MKNKGFPRKQKGALLPLVGLGIYDVSLSEGGGRDEIADRHFLLLSGLHDFRGFLLGVIREDGFPHRVMQATTREARALTHVKDVSKNTAEKNGLYPPRQPRPSGDEIERGKSCPSGEILRCFRLFEEFRMSVDWILRGEGG